MLCSTPCPRSFFFFSFFFFSVFYNYFFFSSFCFCFCFFLNTGKWNNSTYFSSIFSISYHYSAYFSSIFSISFHYSTSLSSIFSKSFHYSTDFSSIFSISFHYSTYFSSILSKSYHYSTFFSFIFWCGTLSNAFAKSNKMISTTCEPFSNFDAISWMVTMSLDSYDRFLRNPCWGLVRILFLFEMVYDVAVDYMLQYYTCDGGEGNRTIVGG